MSSAISQALKISEMKNDQTIKIIDKSYVDHLLDEKNEEALATFGDFK